MVSDLYLQPPTLVEFFYAVGAMDFEPSDSYEALIANREIPELFKPFTLPENLVLRLETTRDCHDILLCELTYSKEHWDKAGLESRGLSGDYPRFCAELYKYLLPETTMANKSSECKGLAILAVAAHRHVGAHARFCSPVSDHVVYEEFGQGLNGWQWQPIEPTTERSVYLENPFPEGYEEYYLKLLEFLSEL